MVGMAVAVVGRVPIVNTEPYSWWLPISVALFSGAPFLLGFLAGKNN